jgi:hypothetical protein
MQKKRPDVASITPGVFLITGIVFIVGATIIGFLIKCPTQLHCFLLYTLVGIGMAGIFLKDAAQTSLAYKGDKFAIRIVGCVGVSFLLYFIDPIGRIKAGGCEPPVPQIVKEPETQAPVGIISEQPVVEKPREKSGTINKPPISSPQKIDDEVIRKTTVQCNGFTKAGAQCKHYTHNINGFCNQHQPD